MQNGYSKLRSKRSQLYFQNLDNFPPINQFKTINLDNTATSQEVQKNAQQSLLDIENDLTFETHNPEADFMTLTKNVRLGQFSKDIDEDLIGRNHRKMERHFILTRNKFSKTKSNLSSQSKLQKHTLIPTKIGSSQTTEHSTFKHSIANFLPAHKLNDLLTRTRSNLLSPRQSFSTLNPADNQYIALTRKSRSSLKPYSYEKTSKIVRISPILQLKDHLSMFPSIQKEFTRKKVFGYE